MPSGGKWGSWCACGCTSVDRQAETYSSLAGSWWPKGFTWATRDFPENDHTKSSRRAYRKSLRKRCRSWESPSLALRWSARFPRLPHAWSSSVHFSCRSSADSGWDWIRRSAVSPRELTYGSKGAREQVRELRSAKGKICSARGQTVDGTATSHLVAKSRKIPLKALVLALQGLDTGQIVAVIVCVERLILLFNPLFGFVGISTGRHRRLTTVTHSCLASRTSTTKVFGWHSYVCQRLPLEAPRNKSTHVHSLTLSRAIYPVTATVPDARAQIPPHRSTFGDRQGQAPVAPSRPSPVEPLHLVRAAQELAPLLGQLLEGPPAFVQLLRKDSRQLAPMPASDNGQRATGLALSLQGKTGAQTISWLQPSSLNKGVRTQRQKSSR